MTRDIHAEAAVLAQQVKADPDNLILRKRMDMARTAAADPARRQDYLAAYPPPTGSSRSARTAKSASYSSRKRPVAARMPTDEQFVLAWQGSESAEEAAEKLGITDHAAWVAVKAGALRKVGVKLREMHLVTSRVRSDRLDVDGLNALIEAKPKLSAVDGGG